MLRCIGPLSLRGAGDGRGHVPHTRIASAIENPQVGKTWQSTREEGERAAQERRGAEGVRGKPSGGVQITSFMLASWRLLATVTLQ